MDKKLKKRSISKCHFCQESAYCTLDLHRIEEGKDGGTYKNDNVVCTCSSCHRKIHGKLIIVDRWYFSTDGRVLHYWDENGTEHYD